MSSWEKLIIQWVNCLTEAEGLHLVESLNDLEDGKLLWALVNTHCSPDKDFKGNEKNAIADFLSKEYPNFVISKNNDSNNKTNICMIMVLLVLSRLAQEPCFHESMCAKLDIESQFRVKNLLEFIYPLGKSLTNKDLSFVTSKAVQHEPKTPTPKRALETFFKSPGTPYLFSAQKAADYNRQINKLKMELEVERDERSELEGDLKIHQDKIKDLQQKLQECSLELRTLRLNNTQNIEEDVFKKDVKDNIKVTEAMYKNEILSLEESLKKINIENVKLQDKNNSLRQGYIDLEAKCHNLEEKNLKMGNIIESLNLQLEKKDEEFCQLKIQFEELYLHIKESNKNSFNNQSFETDESSDNFSPVKSFSTSETLSSVIDVQLQDARRESEFLKIKLHCIDLLLTVNIEEYQKLLVKNISLNKTNQNLSLKIDDNEKIINKHITEKNSIISDFKELKNNFNLLNQEFEDKNVEIINLKDKLNDKENLLTELKHLLKASELDIAKKVESITELQNLLNCHESLINELKCNLHDTKELICQKDSDYTELNNALSNSESVIIRQSDELNCLKKENSDLCSQLHEIKLLTMSKENSIIKLNDALAAVQSESSVRNLKIKSIESELQNLKSCLLEKEKIVLTLEDNLKNKCDQFQKLEVRFTDTCDELDEKCLSVKGLQEEILEMKEATLNQNKEIDHLNKIINDKTFEIEKLIENLKYSEIEINLKKQECEDLKSEVKKCETLINDLKNCITEKETRISNSDLAIKELKCNLQITMKENSNKDMQLQEIKSQVSLKESIIIELEDQIESLTKTTIDQKEYIDKVEQKLNLSKESLTKKSEECLNNQKGILALESEKMSILSQVESLKFEIDDLKVLLNEKVTTIEELNLRLASMEIELSEKSMLNSDIQSKLKAAELEIIVNNDKMSQNESIITEKDAKILKLQEKLDSIKNDLCCKELDIKSLHSINEKAHAESETLSKITKSLEEQITQYKDSLVNKNKVIEQLSSDLNFAKNEVSDKQVELQKLNSLLSEKESMRAQLQKVSENYQSQLSKKDIEIQSHLATISSQEDFLKESDEKHNALQIKLSEKISEVEKLTKDVYETQALNVQLNEKIYALNEEIVIERNNLEKLELQLEDSKVEFLNLSKKLKSAENQEMEKSSEISDLKLQIAKMQMEVDEKSDSLKALNLSVSEIQKELLEKNNLVSELKQKLDAIEKENCNKVFEIENLKCIHKNELDELVEAQSNLKCVAQELNENIKILNEDKENNLIEIENLKAAAADQGTLVGEIEKEVQRLTANLSNKNEEIFRLQSVISNNESIVSELKRQLTIEQQEKLDCIKGITDYKAQLKDAKLEIESKLNEVKNLYSSLEDQDSESSQLKLDLQKTKKILVIKDGEIDCQKSTIKDYECLITELRDNFNSVRKEKFSLINEVENLKSVITVHETRICELKHEISTLQKQIHEKTEEISKNNERHELVSNHCKQILGNAINLFTEVVENDEITLNRSDLPEMCESIKLYANTIKFSLDHKNEQLRNLESNCEKIKEELCILEMEAENERMDMDAFKNYIKSMKSAWETFHKIVAENLISNKEIEKIEKAWVNTINSLKNILEQEVSLNDELKQMMSKREKIEADIKSLRFKNVEMLISNLITTSKIVTNVTNFDFKYKKALTDKNYLLNEDQQEVSEVKALTLQNGVMDDLLKLEEEENMNQKEKLSSIEKEINLFLELLKSFQTNSISSTKSKENAELKQIHDMYEGKLDNMKKKLKAAYKDEITKIKKEQEESAKEKIGHLQAKLEYQCFKHQEEIKKYKKHVSELTTQLWDVGEKLLIEKQCKEEFGQKLQELKAENDKFDQYLERERAVDSLQMYQSNSLDRRTSIQGMQLMGHAFKVEDEEGEIFDTTALSDIDRFRQDRSNNDITRLSILQMRNSKCKPHLKSSYPAETQFHTINYTEEEIKSGAASDDVFNDSLSQSLLTGKKVKGKERSRISYKKPGPPTPNRPSGRLSLSGIMSRSPATRILKEQNNGAISRTQKTGNNLNDITNCKPIDENDSPRKSRRFSNIFKKSRQLTERK